MTEIVAICITKKRALLHGKISFMRSFNSSRYNFNFNFNFNFMSEVLISQTQM